MEAAADYHKPVVILDRPNPITGTIVEGNILDSRFSSFVGLHPIPVRHGMTIGELARMFNEEGWLKNRLRADLTIIPMRNWKREMWYDQTGLRWIPPSPNIPDLMVATVYPGTCLFEGTNISEGRGTLKPFLTIGAPWFTEGALSLLCQDIATIGLFCNPVRFVPVSIPGMADNPKFKDQEIKGIEIRVTDRDHFSAYLAGIELVKRMYEADRDQFKWKESHFDRLCGTDQIRKFIMAGASMDEIKKWIDENSRSFSPVRSKYLLY
jgi:uncharacterized protein YbbC (DUF1343 family)